MLVAILIVNFITLVAVLVTLLSIDSVSRLLAMATFDEPKPKRKTRSDKGKKRKAKK